MDDKYRERKANRKADYLKWYGVKMIKCSACNGSGYYDYHGSHKCSCCNGTGKCKGEPNKIEIENS